MLFRSDHVMRGKPSRLPSTLARNASARNQMTVLKVNQKKIARTSMVMSRRLKIASRDFWNPGIWRVVSNYPKPRPKFRTRRHFVSTLQLRLRRRRLRLWQQILLLKLWRNSPMCSLAIRSSSTIVNSSKINTDSDHWFVQSSPK